MCVCAWEPANERPSERMEWANVSVCVCDVIKFVKQHHHHRQQLKEEKKVFFLIEVNRMFPCWISKWPKKSSLICSVSSEIGRKTCAPHTHTYTRISTGRAVHTRLFYSLPFVYSADFAWGFWFWQSTPNRLNWFENFRWFHIVKFWQLAGEWIQMRHVNSMNIIHTNR